MAWPSIKRRQVICHQPSLPFFPRGCKGNAVCQKGIASAALSSWAPYRLASPWECISVPACPGTWASSGRTPCRMASPPRWRLRYPWIFQQGVSEPPSSLLLPKLTWERLGSGGACKPMPTSAKCRFHMSRAPGGSHAGFSVLPGCPWGCSQSQAAQDLVAVAHWVVADCTDAAAPAGWDLEGM